MKCSYCGKDIDDQKSHNITFQSSVNKNIAICQECVMKMASQVQDDEGDFDIDDILGLSLGDEDDEKPKKKKSSKIQKSDIKPKEIKAYLDESVINQDNAKKILIHHYHSSALISSPSNFISTLSLICTRKSYLLKIHAEWMSAEYFHPRAEQTPVKSAANALPRYTLEHSRAPH